MIDINTAIGHWPFRRIPNQSAEELRTLLERRGITRAAVAHTHGLFYKNCHDANLELIDAIAPHGGFYIGIVTLNPMYAEWERDLAVCAEYPGFAGLRLVPRYHDYSLADSKAIAIVRAAAAVEFPVFIPHRIVDVRQCHWMDTQSVVDPANVIALARSVPEAKIVLTEYPATPSLCTDAEGNVTIPNLFFETSRMLSAYGRTLENVVHQLGANRVLFGTGAPFKELSPSLLKIASAQLTDEERSMVSEGSARALFGERIERT